MENSELARALEERYGLSVQRLEPAPRGWVGETYVATDNERGLVFVKLYRKGRLPPNAVAALPVLVELRQRGIDQISFPIPSIRGSLHEPLIEDAFVLFEHIDGVLTEAFDREALGDLIARVHEQTRHVKTPVARETFAPEYGADLIRMLADSRDYSGRDEPRLWLKEYLEGNGDQVKRDWEALRQVARGCREARFEPVLTHGDSLFNVIQGGTGVMQSTGVMQGSTGVVHNGSGRIHLVDWDELLLAPAERDTWFYISQPAFWKGYGARGQGHQEKQLATRFYAGVRYIEDLLGLAREIMGDGTASHRAHRPTQLLGPWLPEVLRIFRGNAASG